MTAEQTERVPEGSSELPVGSITFVLTDVEGSTRLWEEDPGAMSKALVDHDLVVDKTIEHFGGVRVKGRSEGDSTFSVFTDPADALAGGLALQRALSSQSWPTLNPIRARMAIHTGEAALRDGEYFGAAVTRAAKLRAVAHGSQIILSQATRDLTLDKLPEGSNLKDLGAHRLKDLLAPERIFQLSHPDLPADYPPLTSLDTRPNNLPVQLNSFIGRKEELGQLKEILGTTPFVTLSGALGSGKSRLALALAAELLDDYVDGVWLVNFAPISDPLVVPQAVASAVGVRGVPDPLEYPVGERRRSNLARKLIDYLSRRRLLLVLDNCDDVASGCGILVEPVLRVCPSVSIIATSTDPLKAPGELVWDVPPLDYPEAHGVNPPEDLLNFESVRLFIDRAQLARPDFQPTDTDAVAIGEISRIVLGSPEKIELAAQWMKVLTCEQIAARVAADPSRLLKRRKQS